MKKQFPDFNVLAFYSKMLLLMMLSLILLQCKKNSNKISEDQESISLTSQSNNKPLKDKFQDLTKEVLSLAQKKEFKQLIYNECRVQQFGDYYVRVEDLLSLPNARSYFSDEKRGKITNLLNDLKILGSRTPIIFYPSVETKEDNNTDLSRVTFCEGCTLGVNGEDWYVNDEYPGYKFGTDGELEYSQQIAEEFAWNNDVWVIGEEENCSIANMQEAPEDTILNPISSRYQGQPEYGAIIQVTNLGQLEPWINGN